MNAWGIVLVVAAAVAAGVTLLRLRVFRGSPVERPTAAERSESQLAAIDAFGPLSLSDRLTIRLFVRQGKSLRESRLAPAAVCHARRAVVNERTRLSQFRWRELLPITWMTGFIIVMRDFELGTPVGVIILLWLAALVPILAPGRGLLRRYEQALALNQDLQEAST